MQILFQCRPGFEKEALAEVTSRFLSAQGQIVATPKQEDGFCLVEAKARRETYDSLHWKEWIFVRQWWIVQETLALPGPDRISPIVNAAKRLLEAGNAPFFELCLEWPDSNEGRETSRFLTRFSPLLEAALEEAQILDPEKGTDRLALFFPDGQSAWIGVATERSAPWVMGIPRLRSPAEAPSRSTLKLAEAFEAFLSVREQDLYLRAGMKAVDLGAAPGGWTWQLVARGMHVDAVDNGPLKGAVLGHPAVTHYTRDGFSFKPKAPVDWLVCDMVEQPRRIAALMLEWVLGGWTRQAIFNLKLQPGRRLEEVRFCLALLEKGLEEGGLRGRVIARQLYHDREEVTVYLRLEGKSHKNVW